MKITAFALMVIFVSTSLPASAQETEPTTPTTQLPQHQNIPPQGCEMIRKGGPIAGIVIASIYFPLLPMSIPVLITQTKKLKRRRKQIYEQQLRGCP